MASEKLTIYAPIIYTAWTPAPFPDDFVCTPPPAADQRRPPATINCTPKSSAAANFRCVQPHPPPLFRQQWSPKSRHGDSSDDEEDDDDVDDDDELDDVAEERNNFDENVVTVAKMSDFDSNKYGEKTKLLTALGINKEILTRVTVIDSSNNENYSGNLDRLGNYYRRYENCPSTSPTQKDAVGLESCCGFSGRKEGPSGDSVRSIFSDPISGMLMDDAMILPCGHSFGSGGMQHILRVKTCYSCSQPVSDDSIITNLSLRVAVEAFKREEELHADRISKRRRERYEQDKGITNDSTSMDFSSGRGVQFPFTVTDRVIIKGNKRTPPRFVGREAIVTTQCLNGWYVVKTLDNAESVKLQYRSLAKISDNGSSVKPSEIKTTPPSWL